MVPAHAVMAPHDRSIPPEIISIATPSVAIPNTGMERRKLDKFPLVAKTGEIYEKTAIRKRSRPIIQYSDIRSFQTMFFLCIMTSAPFSYVITARRRLSK